MLSDAVIKLIGIKGPGIRSISMTYDPATKLINVKAIHRKDNKVRDAEKFVLFREEDYINADAVLTEHMETLLKEVS